MTSGVEKVYAEALYELAAETGEKERLFDELMGLAKVFSDNPGLCDVLQAPTVTNEEKYTMLKNIFGGRISQMAYNFLCVLAGKGRARHMEGIAEEYKKMWYAENNIMDVTVTSVRPLSADQRRRLADRLSASYGKRIVMTEKIDPSIMGGLKVTCGDRMLDGSVKTKLNELRSSMKNARA